MKNSIIILFMFLLTSCAVQKPIIECKKQLHNEALIVTPSWKGEKAQTVGFLHIGGGAAAAAYGYYSPPLVINDIKVDQGVNTLIYGIAGVAVTRFLTELAFGHPKSRKYKKEQAQKWVFDLNHYNNSNYVIAEEKADSSKLIIVPQKKMKNYFNNLEKIEKE